MTLVRTDARSRVSLGKVLEPNQDYRVSVSPHGTVTLEPVTTISKYEEKLLSTPGVAHKLEDATADLERGDVHSKHRRK